MSKIHELYMKHYKYEVLIDHMTGKKYQITTNREKVYVEEEK